MTDFRKLAFVGLLSLGLASVGTAGCSSSSGSTGTGGSGGAHTSGTGGSSTTGTGGTTGSGGGGGAASACTPAPADGVIADFAGDAGVEIMGGVTTYGGNAQPNYTISGGTLNVMENFAATASPQYVGTVLYFNNCIDASAFSGVEFDFGGTISGCTIQYSSNDVPHDDMGTDKKGTCTLGTACYSPQASITTVSATAAQVQEPWITTAGGNPSAVLDPKQLTGIQWQFTIPAAADGGTASACMANLNISQIKFYK
ncbi:MAG TPA: hypothetical protein VHO06_21760 [Polyangia bacterium]|nr:hypothetical protein [Polyangia bacterium]